MLHGSHELALQLHTISTGVLAWVFLLSAHSPSCSPQLLPHFRNGRSLVHWYLSTNWKSLNERAANEYVGHNLSSEGPHMLKNNYLHADFWPQSWALLKVCMQHIFYCSAEELASAMPVYNLLSPAMVFFWKNCLISLSKCQNKLE